MEMGRKPNRYLFSGEKLLRRKDAVCLWCSPQEHPGIICDFTPGFWDSGLPVEWSISGWISVTTAVKTREFRKQQTVGIDQDNEIPGRN